MKTKFWILLFSICLTLFTVYTLLDTFVISRTYVAEVSEAEEGLFHAVKTEETQTRTYWNGNVSISLSTWTVNNSAVYVADVQLSSVKYLKTAFAFDSFGKNLEQTTSEIAAEHEAVFAINGDNYGTQENGFVIRNGVVYREKGNRTKVLCIYNDGTMKIENPKEVTAKELADQGAWQVFSFGPALVDDDEIAVQSYSEVKFAKASNPRTAIGMIGKLHYLFVVSDGRTDESSGLTLLELAQFMQQLGAVVAYNLDGGGSSTMVLNDEVINQPTSSGRKIQEREVTDIIYIG